MKNIAKVAALTLALTSTPHTVSVPAKTVTNKELPSLTAGVSKVLNSITQSNEHVEYKTMYVSGTKVNVRNQPSIDSDIITYFYYNDEISVSESHVEDWYVVLFGNEIGYINKNFVSSEKHNYILYDVPYAKNKTWMSYTTITSRNSKQYKLQELAHTGKYGIRVVDERYCVALGSHFGCEIGQYFDLILANGTVIPCIMGDQKDDRHTDSTNIITVNSNCLSEFIVDRKALDSNAKRDGDMSSVSDEWNSHVVTIKVYDKVVEIDAQK